MADGWGNRIETPAAASDVILQHRAPSIGGSLEEWKETCTAPGPRDAGHPHDASARGIPGSLECKCPEALPHA